MDWLLATYIIVTILFFVLAGVAVSIGSGMFALLVLFGEGFATVLFLVMEWKIKDNE